MGVKTEADRVSGLCKIINVLWYEGRSRSMLNPGSLTCSVYCSFSDDNILLVLSPENISMNMNLDLINIFIRVPA